MNDWTFLIDSFETAKINRIHFCVRILCFCHLLLFEKYFYTLHEFRYIYLYIILVKLQLLSGLIREGLHLL